MTPQEHVRDLTLRLAAMKPEGPNDVSDLLVLSFENAINEERERIAAIIERQDLPWLAKRIRWLKE
jgi:hypothetical protein